jgi:hypothetical protein
MGGSTDRFGWQVNDIEMLLWDYNARFRGTITYDPAHINGLTSSLIRHSETGSLTLSHLIYLLLFFPFLTFPCHSSLPISFLLL